MRRILIRKRIRLVVREPPTKKLLVIRRPETAQPPSYRRRRRLIKLFCWMTDEELRSCCKQVGVYPPKKKSFTIAERQRIMRCLEAKGWRRADVSVSPPKLTR